MLGRGVESPETEYAVRPCVRGCERLRPAGEEPMDTRRAAAVAAATVLVAAWAGAAGDGLPVVLPAGDFVAREVDYRLKLPPAGAAELRKEALAHARLWTKPERPIQQA